MSRNASGLTGTHEARLSGPGGRGFVRPPGATLLALGVLALIGSLIAYPLGRMMVSLFFADGTVSFQAFANASRLPGLGKTLMNTGIVVLIGGGTAMCIAAIFAWLNERTNARMGAVSDILPVLPFMIPPIASAIGMVILFSPTAGLVNVALRPLLGIEGNAGPLNIFSWPGLTLLYAVELLPYAYLVLSAALRNLDPAMEEASRMSGAGAFATMRRVTLPAVRPALGSGAMLIVMVGLSLYSAAAIVGIPARIDILSTRIVELLRGTYPPETDVAVALSGLILVIVGIAWFLQVRVLRSGHYAMTGGKGARAARVELRGWRYPARIMMLCYLLMTVVLPVLGLLHVSLQSFWSTKFDLGNLTLESYREVFSSNEESQLAILNSLRLGLLAATVGMTVATTVALLARRRPQKLTKILDGLIKAPGALSHIVIALALIVALSQAPFFLGGTIFILLIAYIVMYLPQGSIVADAAVSQVADELIEASHMSGAGEARTLRRVALPLMLPGLAAGWALLFVLTVGELVGSVMLASPDSPVIGYVILGLYQNGTLPNIAAISLLLTVMTSTVVFTVLRLTRGKIAVETAGV